MIICSRSANVVMHSPVGPARSRGFSLVELLIALALGLIIVAALSQLFVNVSRTNQEMAKTNSQIESARFAMQFLQGDVVHAGYWGGYVPAFDDYSQKCDPATDDCDVPAAKPTPVCQSYVVATPWTEAYQESLLAIPLEVYGPGALPAGCGAVVTDRLANTDLLIVRHAATCVAGDASCDGYSAGKLYFQVSNCKTDTERYVLQPNTYPLFQLNCTTMAGRRKFIQNIYYIRDWANTAGDGIPTLVRSEFELSGGVLSQQAPEALVEGIERFHVELGIDRLSQTGAAINYAQDILWTDEENRTTPTNRGDGVPEAAFERCLSEDATCTWDELANVVAVKMYLLARATESTPGLTNSKDYTLGSLAVPAFDDNFKRHVFSQTVRLNNIAGRRETSGP